MNEVIHEYPNPKWPDGTSKFVIHPSIKCIQSDGLSHPFNDGTVNSGYGIDLIIEYTTPECVEITKELALDLMKETCHTIITHPDIIALINRYKCVPVELSQLGITGHTNRCPDGKIGVLLYKYYLPVVSAKKQIDFIKIHPLSPRDTILIRNKQRKHVNMLYSKIMNGKSI